MATMTLDDIKSMDREMLTPAIVGKIIGCDPYYISLQARQRPELLGFPYMFMGHGRWFRAEHSSDGWKEGAQYERTKK